MSGMAFTLPHPFHESAVSSSSNDEVPGRFMVSINGQGFMLDTANQAFTDGRESLALIRTQADGSAEPSGAAISPEDLWPRQQTSWHMGAGQEYLDEDTSDRARYWSSLGIDPWTWGKISLLPDTDHLLTTAGSDLGLARAGNYLYWADGTSLKFAVAPYSSWTDSGIQAGETGVTVHSIASDGSTVWAAIGANGVHSSTVGASSSAHYNALQATLLGFVKDRLMAADGAAIYNITASGAAPSALFTHPNSSWVWTGFASGKSVIFAAGHSGDRSSVYKIPIKADGTGLDAPIVAGQLPAGELVYSIVGYLGFVVAGTNKGFRLGSEDDAGNITFGSLVKTGAVRCLEPQDRFVWFGWDNYDNSHTGLGRMDLSMLTAPFVPAYSTDIMAEAQGSVVAACTGPDGRCLFGVAASGLYQASDDKVPSGQIESGKMSYGITDSKIALRMDLKHEALPHGAYVRGEVSGDEALYASAGVSGVFDTTAPSSPLHVPELAATLLQVRLTLAGGAVLERYALRAYPSYRRGEKIAVPLLLYESVETRTSDASYDTLATYQKLKGLVGTAHVNSYKEGALAASVFVEDVSFQRHSPTKDARWWNGTLVCILKVLGD